MAGESLSGHQSGERELSAQESSGQGEESLQDLARHRGGSTPARDQERERPPQELVRERARPPQQIALERGRSPRELAEERGRSPRELAGERGPSTQVSGAREGSPQPWRCSRLCRTGTPALDRRRAFHRRDRRRARLSISLLRHRCPRSPGKLVRARHVSPAPGRVRDRRRNDARFAMCRCLFSARLCVEVPGWRFTIQHSWVVTAHLFPR